MSLSSSAENLTVDNFTDADIAAELRKSMEVLIRVSLTQPCVHMDGAIIRIVPPFLDASMRGTVPFRDNLSSTSHL
jgi:hypothetical protein